MMINNQNSNNNNEIAKDNDSAWNIREISIIGKEPIELQPDQAVYDRANRKLTKLWPSDRFGVQ